MAKGTATIDFGATPVDNGTFVITNAAFNGLTYAEPFFMGSDSTADNDAVAHQMAGTLMRATADAPVGNDVTVRVDVLVGLVNGQFKLRLAGD